MYDKKRRGISQSIVFEVRHPEFVQSDATQWSVVGFVTHFYASVGEENAREP